VSGPGPELRPSPSARFYGYARCGTCRKARQWLQQRGVAVEEVDITTTPPSLEELRQAWEALPDPRRLFNTSGASYRALGAAAVKAMEPAQALEALAADGRLIRRPFLITPSGTVLTGFDPIQWEQAFPASLPAS
jgi:arsenate reductase (glutaredoxin)